MERPCRSRGHRGSGGGSHQSKHPRDLDPDMGAMFSVYCTVVYYKTIRV